jgi:phosphocarrier protein HPr
LNRRIQLSHNTIVLNKLGMHARPAAQIAQMAMAAESNIWLSDGKTHVDASSIIDILTLCATRGSCILIQAESLQDAGILDKIKSFFDKGFGELTE